MKVVIDGVEYLPVPKSIPWSIRAGDFVEVLGADNPNVYKKLRGKGGRVICVLKLGSFELAVEFAHKFPDGHSCDGRTLNGHGYYFAAGELKVIN